MSTTPQITTIEQTLIDLGLGQNEAKLYEVLLQNPDATIPLLRQKTAFSRTMLYYILENLKGYELVESKDIGPKTIFNAAPPEKLEEMFEDQEKELKRQKDQLKNVIGDLRSVYALSHNKPGVRFFEGKEGIKEVTFDSLKAKNMIYTFLDIEAIQKFAPEVNKAYVAERLKHGIFKKQICLDTPFARERYKQLPPKDRLLEVRFIKREANPFKTGLQIYDDTISYSTLTPEKQIGVIIHDANIAAMHKSLFEYIWETLSPLSESKTSKFIVPTQPPVSAPEADVPKNNIASRSRDNLGQPVVP